MTIEELNKRLEAYRAKLRSRGTVVRSGPSGPIGMSVIDILVEIIESHDRRIVELERASRDAQMAQVRQDGSLSGTS